MDPSPVTTGLASLDARFATRQPESAGKPVFVLASGWRSGSTLMQRLVTSARSILVWGEPYDHSGLIRRLAESFVPFSDGWPPTRSIVDPAHPPRDDAWIANAYPHPDHLLAAHRAFLERLFDTPAREAGFSRWGVKGVRLSGDHARYLQRVLGDPRFIFIHRNPYDAYLSYRLLHDVRPSSYWWYWRWPDHQVDTAERFGVMWRTLTESFLEHAPSLDAVLIPYESLIRGDALTAVEDLIEGDVDRSVLENRVGGTHQQRGAWDTVETTLSADDRRAIGAAAGNLARDLGYLGPTVST